MAGQKFQYDESGGTFYYFVLSFLALLLIPSTYYLWPRKDIKDETEEEIICNCDGCKKKRRILEESKPWKVFKDLFIKFLILSGWCFLAYLAYKVSQFEYEYANFDPYEILGVPVGSPETTIKRAYRRLSVILHPDKETGDEKAFMTLTKAYQALTDDEARRNWEKYGNPDGPGAMSFGIALPSWIVEKENSVWVLGLYALIFMVAMPTVVGMWWYKSIKYSSDKVLLDTTKMYYFFFHKTPSMPLKRVIMILGASLEFEKKFNGEIIERDSDNYEVPKLFGQLHNLGEKNRERPLYYKYSLKARALIHAHLTRIPLNPETLDRDRLIILKKCPVLIQEMINCISQLILLAYAQRVPRLLNIETLENCMKLCPMIIQALWECKSPLIQLPYVQEEHLKHFILKKRCIRNIQQFARLKPEDRRTVLKFLKDDQFEDVIRVVGKMPYVELNVRCEVIDDEATTVYTAGAIVTVTVSLRRKNLNEVFGDSLNIAAASSSNNNNNNNNKEPDEKDAVAIVNGGEDVQPKIDSSHPKEEDDQSVANKISKSSVWQRKPQKSAKKCHNKKQTKKPQTKSNALQKKMNWERKQREKLKIEENSKSDPKESGGKSSSKKKKDAENASDDNEKNNEDVIDGDNEENQEADSNSDSSDDDDDNDDESNKGDDSSDDEQNNKKNEASQGKNSNYNDDDDGDDDWDKFRSGMSRKDRVLEGRRKMSHSVHCPYFPEDKQEYWWVYISDRKSRTLLTSPYHLTELVDYDEIQLKFTAPRWPGLYTFTVCLRSDSYLGFDQTVDIKLDVKEAPEIPTEHPQWDISDDEDEDKDEGSGGDISEFTTDEDVEDE